MGAPGRRGGGLDGKSRSGPSGPARLQSALNEVVLRGQDESVGPLHHGSFVIIMPGDFPDDLGGVRALRDALPAVKSESGICREHIVFFPKFPYEILLNFVRFH